MTSQPATFPSPVVAAALSFRASDELSSSLGNLHRAILDSISDGVYLLDIDGRIAYWNASAQRISGYTAEDVVGRRCSDGILRHCTSGGTELCATGCPMRETLQDGSIRRRDLWLHHRLGHQIPVSVRTAPVRNAAGRIVGCVEVFSDITHRIVVIEQAKELNRLAFLDELTAVGNRRSLEAKLRELFDDPSGMGMPVGVLFVDIDDFKSLNDLHGHGSGDRVLCAVATTLGGNLRSYDLVGRWGGDEFVVVMVATTLSDLAHLGNRLCTLVAMTEVEAAGARIPVTVSIGGALTRPGDEVPSLIARADTNLYESKKAGRNRSTVR